MSQTNKRFLVVDAFVIGKASEHSLDDATWKAGELLNRIIRVCHKVVLDPKPAYQSEDTILSEYGRQAKSDLTRWWIVAIQTRADKVVRRPKSSVTIFALSDPDDQKYFQVAINSPHKIIISEDSHFTSIKNDSQVTGLGISVWNLDEALSNL